MSDWLTRIPFTLAVGLVKFIQMLYLEQNKSLTKTFPMNSLVSTAGVHGGDDQEAARRGQGDENVQEETSRGLEQPGREERSA